MANLVSVHEEGTVLLFQKLRYKFVNDISSFRSKTFFYIDRMSLLYSGDS